MHRRGSNDRDLLEDVLLTLDFHMKTLRSTWSVLAIATFVGASRVGVDGGARDAVADHVSENVSGDLADMIRGALLADRPHFEAEYRVTTTPAVLPSPAADPGARNTPPEAAAQPVHGPVIEQQWRVLSSPLGTIFQDTGSGQVIVNSREGSFRITPSERHVQVLRGLEDPLGVGMMEFLEASEGFGAHTAHPTLVEEIESAIIDGLDRRDTSIRVSYRVPGSRGNVASTQVRWEWGIEMETVPSPRLIEHSMTISDMVDGEPVVRNQVVRRVAAWDEVDRRPVPRRIKETIEARGLRASRIIERMARSDGTRGDLTAGGSPGPDCWFETVYLDGWEIADENLGLRFVVGSTRFTFLGTTFEASEPIRHHPCARLEEVLRHAVAMVP